MTKGQENKLSMFLAVEKVLLLHQGVWQGHAGFAEAVAHFQEAVAGVMEKQIVADGNRKGVTQDKAAARKNMADVALWVGAGVEAFASKTKNHSLKDFVHVTITDFLFRRDTDALKFAQGVAGLGREYLGELGNYNVTAEKLMELNAAIAVYKGLIGSVRMEQGASKTAREEMVHFFALGMLILKERLDLLLKHFKGSVFYGEYRAVRKIVRR